ncbi:guanylate kinase [Natranaerobius thermophilus]|uniref:Guanylate kinase n=1 Tax=Natranaerobius thermophilus (strain ATCC BAA-1301 / DSM 18059 / JW/NM-WN-LF) TaxID=457570 RepID=B2A2J7_NATTJ|nr:guanylate kinase [Natranaerobius thermophilus]ACB84912.1 guanylate kinase [Natranaerobius thermophilus JW/NM-WN-LF]
MKKEGLLVVLSGPSGVGKGTICDHLLDKYSDLEYSISMTTRSPRAGEIHGEDYYFVSKSEFQEMIADDEFLEWAEVFGNYYGTPRKFVNSKLREGKSVVLEIDIQGALQVKQRCPNGVFIFLLPPSLDELHKRIRKRGTEQDKDMQTRLTAAKNEIKTVHQYDYAVVNNNIGDTADLIYSVIKAEKCSVSRVGQKLVKEVIDNE